MKKTVLLLLATAVAGGVFTLGPFPLPHRTSSPRTTPPAIPAQTSLRPSPNLPALDVLTSPTSENRERPALSPLDSLPVSSAPASTNSSPRSPLDLLAATYVGAAATGDKIPHPSSTSTYTVTDNGAAINVPENMVYVPAGNFVMGEGTSLHTVYLDAYCINKYEVTNAEYLAFINESGYSTLPRH